MFNNKIMFSNKILFNIKEAYRKFLLCLNESILYFFLNTSLYLFIIVFFTTFLNYTYNFKLNLKGGSIPLAGFTASYFYSNNILILFFISIIFIFIYTAFYINKRYIQKFLDIANPEIMLIKKLKGNSSVVRTPIIYLVFFMNIFSLFLVITFAKYTYGILTGYIRKYMQSLLFLKFTDFQISLFLFLLLISSIFLLITIYYMFWISTKKIKN